MKNKTGFLVKVKILNDIWMNHRDSEKFADLIENNDIGFPLAHCFLESIVFYTPRGGSLVEATFDELLELLGTEDEGFESVDEFSILWKEDKD